jgi:hypothetical protein
VVISRHFHKYRFVWGGDITANAMQPRNTAAAE